MRRVILTALLCLCATAGFATAASNQLTFAGAGFSIAALEGCDMFMMWLPSSDDFRPNVGIQIQRYPGTRDEYIALSRDQFRQIGATVVREQKKGPSGWAVEYTGDMDGRPLHWYSRAELKNGKAYLATATATEEQWPAVSTKLRACVDSLRLVK